MMLAGSELNVSMLENCRIFYFGSLPMTGEICRNETK